MRTNAKTRDLALAGLMIAAGVVLHSFPPLIGGMKPDFSLIMLILYALLRRDKKVTLAAGLATGVITAITTGFPGGQIPNVIDKTLTTLMLLGITALPESYVNALITSAVGTLFSGLVFLGSAYFIAGLPVPFATLFTSVVLPAAGINTVAVAVLYPVALKITSMLDRRTAVGEKA